MSKDVSYTHLDVYKRQILFFMKVLPYTEISIIAPLGISYYTLQIRCV